MSAQESKAADSVGLQEVEYSRDTPRRLPEHTTNQNSKTCSGAGIYNSLFCEMTWDEALKFDVVW